MTPSDQIPTVMELKAQAKRLRAALANEGDFIKHSEALELIAQQRGFRDWNTLHAKASKRPAKPIAIGDRVSGSYLGQPFQARILGLQTLGQDSAYRRVVLELDQPVDVVRFESFSSFRRRVRATIGQDGQSMSRTSDGAPHLALNTVA